jgi:hypothetical protein
MRFIAPPGKEKALLSAACCTEKRLHLLHSHRSAWRTHVPESGIEGGASGHLASPHIDDFRRIAPDLLAEPPDITLWREIKG